MTNMASEFDDFINEPRETLDIAVKDWLDLANHDHRALVAKEIIALANHGGGAMVIGFTEKNDGSFVQATGRPINLDSWSQDAIQSIVSKYVDPTVQCRVLHRFRSDGADKHPIIIVPGGHRVPVRAKAGAPDNKKLVAHRVYVRRPGPTSEEPQSAEEWDRLLGRILQNRKDELLEAMRSIMSGVVPTNAPASPTRLNQLTEFEVGSSHRWDKRVLKIPTNDPPRFPQGHYANSFAIDGEFDRKSLSDLRDLIQSAVRNHSGWPPFLTLNRKPYLPTPADGAVECWIGPDNDGSYDSPAHHDFWRVSPNGILYTRRGYPEDGGWKGVKPGTTFDITSPTRRLGEAILEARYIAEALSGASADLIISGNWTGLAGRYLVSHGNPNRILDTSRYRCSQATYETKLTVPLASLVDTLPEVVWSILAPLYELFEFFRLPKRLVEEELADLQRHRF